MIPPDVASSLKVVLPDHQSATQAQQTQPVAPTQRITDVLSNLVPGQRIFAEIQALLPNGAYRATVAQRDVTLALPFSAKPGDSLELEVAESDGKLTLAFVANRSDAAAQKTTGDSVATTLSSTGRLIGDLMKGLEGEGKRAPPAALNGNQPLLETGSKTGADIAPLLKQALSQSGMFYESHQARWVAGELPIEHLRQEPQGKQAAEANALAQNRAAAVDQGNQAKSDQPLPAGQRADGNVVPRELMPLVQQQLDGLANQNFAWQGQVWPGQKMWWEISENQDERRNADDAERPRWQTRLKLELPSLGAVDATLHLFPGGEVALQIVSASETGENRLQEGGRLLQDQFEAAGLKIRQLLISHDDGSTA